MKILDPIGDPEIVMLRDLEEGAVFRFHDEKGAYLIRGSYNISTKTIQATDLSDGEQTEFDPTTKVLATNAILVINPSEELVKTGAHNV